VEEPRRAYASRILTAVLHRSPMRDRGERRPASSKCWEAVRRLKVRGAAIEVAGETIVSDSSLLSVSLGMISERRRRFAGPALWSVVRVSVLCASSANDDECSAE
jgi:hypothetical protein